tara:strand:+ start:351 stop:593 length:243 start_codon:yes stop_codon:yes gene_type:complete
MIKIWFLLVLMSAPNLPSVKYQGTLYPTEEQCVVAQASFLNLYEAKPKEYKDSVSVDAFCLPFDAFPIKGMNYEGTKFGA